ncbi:Reticulon family protein [Zostera marina]|uniref:Reticulon-like protein n=1 Tax=Zostera marina TaxID=29655 RepID=A0A0K9P9S4_ZOSMR|nr:Reticulon family protein [Zostera marina]
MPEHNPVEEIFEGIMETINDHIPKNKSVRFLEEDNRSPISAQMNKFNKLLGRQNTIHGVFGGGKSADVILWRNKKISSGIMVAATAIWVLFELLEYHFLTLACFSLVIGMVIQFVWTNASYLMNSPSSSVPRLVLPRDMFANIGACLDTEVNRFLCFLQDVTSGKDLKHFVFIVSALWVAAVIGSYCNFVTVIYIGFVAAHTLPVFYEKYEDEVDGFVDNLLKKLKTQYNKIDQGVLRKIPKGNLKPKKND